MQHQSNAQIWRTRYHAARQGTVYSGDRAVGTPEDPKAHQLPKAAVATLEQIP